MKINIIDDPSQQILTIYIIWKLYHFWSYYCRLPYSLSIFNFFRTSNERQYGHVFWYIHVFRHLRWNSWLQSVVTNSYELHPNDSKHIEQFYVYDDFEYYLLNLSRIFYGSWYNNSINLPLLNPNVHLSTNISIDSRIRIYHFSFLFFPANTNFPLWHNPFNLYNSLPYTIISFY
jgi:hypothetical protein